MRIWMQKSASMQKRTSPLKFGELAEKSELNSVSNFSTKARAAMSVSRSGLRGACGWTGSIRGSIPVRNPLTLEGSFSAVSKPIFASKYAFFSVFRDLHENHLLASKS